MKRILSIGDPVPYLEYLKRIDDVELFHIQAPNRVAWLSSLAVPAHSLIIPLTDTERVVSLACALHQVHPFDAVVSFTELGLLPAVRIAQELNLPTTSLRAVQVTRNKLAMRQAIEAAGIGSIAYRLCQTADEAKRFAAAITYPIILKPATGYGSTAVFLAKSPVEVDEAYAAIAREWGSTKHVLAEEYVDGPEVSVEAYSIEGEHHVVTVTDKLTTGAPRFVEIGHAQPSMHPEDVQAQIIRAVTEFLTAINHTNGPTHTEVKIGPRGPVIIESHTRPGGGFIVLMMEKAFGVEMVSLTARHLLGEPVSPARRFNKAACVRHLVLPQGVVESIEEVERVRQTPGVAFVDLYLKPGDVIGEIRSSFSRHGCVVTTGETTAEAIDLAERMVRQIRVKVRG